MTLTELAEDLAAHKNVNYSADRIKILAIDGIEASGDPDTVRMRDVTNPNAKDEENVWLNLCPVKFGIRHEFRSIVKQFRSEGSMNTSIFSMLSVDSASELVAQQADDHMLRNAGFSDEIVLTLVAIKILHDFFDKDKKLWNLVERKARRFVLSQGLTKE